MKSCVWSNTCSLARLSVSALCFGVLLNNLPLATSNHKCAHFTLLLGPTHDTKPSEHTQRSAGQGASIERVPSPADMVGRENGTDVPTTEQPQPLACDIQQMFELRQPSSGEQDLTRLSSSYANYCISLRTSCPDLPRVPLAFRGLGYRVPRDHHEREETSLDRQTYLETIPNLLTVVPNLLRRLVRRASAASHRKRANPSGGLTPEGTVSMGPSSDFCALAACSGVIPAGSMTIIMAPPGHGKSVLLKALSARSLGDPNLSGEIRWGGVNREEANRRGLQLRRLCAYAEQVDNVYPTLTTLETIDFAVNSATSSLDLLPQEHRPPANFSLSHEILALTGLTSCADTLVGGSGGIRGISGGQRRRTCLAETLGTQARVLALDEITTGLDSATSIDVIRSIGAWARLTGATVIMALLQPSPEILAEFDRTILLREGHTVYHGPMSELEGYLRSSFHVECPPERDLGDFVTAFLADPDGVRRAAGRKAMEHKQFLARRRSSSGVGGRSESNLQTNDVDSMAASTSAAVTPHRVVFHLEQSSEADLTFRHPEATRPADADSYKSTSDGTVLCTSSLVEAYRRSQWFAIHEHEASTVCSDEFTINMKSKQEVASFRSSLTPYVHAQFYSSAPHGSLYYIRLLLVRQLRLLLRSRHILLPRLAKDLGYGLVAGSLFYQRSTEDYASKISLAFIGSSALSFSNMSEVTLACEARRVISAQLDGATYSALNYIVAQAVIHLPLSFLETTVFALPVYFLSGSTLTASGFFFFFLVLFAFNECMSAMFKSVAFAVSEPSIGQVLVEPLVTLFQSASGFLITRGQIPVGAIWVFWCSPFSWSIRSIAQCEFFSSRYDDSVVTGFTAAPVQERRGSAYLEAFQISTDSAFKWAGVGLLLGYWILLNVFASWLLNQKRMWLAVGTQRTGGENTAVTLTDDGSAIKRSGGAIEMPNIIDMTRKDHPPPVHTLSSHPSSSGFPSSASVGLPLVQRHLHWRNVSYFVPVKGAGGGEVGKAAEPGEKQLLSSITGHCAPGCLMALMGSSGAGKVCFLVAQDGESGAAQ